MKPCSKCGIEKDLSDFHRNAGERDGHHSRCKSCRREDARREHAENPEAAYRRLRRWQANNPEAVRKLNRGVSQRHRAAHPEKVAARSAVNTAIAVGKLIRPSQCSIDNCEGGDIEAHHSSYAQKDWMRVTWLCAQHHHDLHRKIRDAELNP